MPAPIRYGIEKGSDKNPHLKVINARMFRRNILYFLFFLEDRMVFVKIGKSSFLLDNKFVIQWIFHRYSHRIGFIILIFLGIAFMLLLSVNVGLALMFLIGVSAMALFIFFGYRSYLNRLSHLKRSEENEILDIISRRNFRVSDIIKLSDRSLDIFYSNINSVYIVEPEDDKRLREENSIGYLIFEQNCKLKNQKVGNENKNDSLSKKYNVYDIPVSGDITECERNINRFIPNKIISNQHVASLGYTAGEQHDFNQILGFLLVVGGIGWLLTVAIFADQKLFNDLIIFIGASTAILVISLYAYLGKYWYKKRYFLYWSETKRRWHAKHSIKLMILFIIVIDIAFVNIFNAANIVSCIYDLSPDSIFAKNSSPQQSDHEVSKLREKYGPLYSLLPKKMPETD